jgi:hypothetical protein
MDRMARNKVGAGSPTQKFVIFFGSISLTWLPDLVMQLSVDIRTMSGYTFSYKSSPLRRRGVTISRSIYGVVMGMEVYHTHTQVLTALFPLSNDNRHFQCVTERCFWGTLYILKPIRNSYISRQTLLYSSSWTPSSPNLMHLWQHDLDKGKESKSRRVK